MHAHATILDALLRSGWCAPRRLEGDMHNDNSHCQDLSPRCHLHARWVGR